MSKQYVVYMMASLSNSALYIGMTSDLSRRVQAHQEKIVEGFSKQYNCVKLVYYRPIEGFDAALIHEKRLKGWTRLKKVALIEINNPRWLDLAGDI